MRRKGYRKTGLMLGILPLILGACGMFPEEMEVLPAPVLQSYEIENYEEVVVKRGELRLEETIKCKYAPAKKEDLAFLRGGEYVEQIYVTEGQEVKAGDLLAQLVLEDLDRQLADKEYEIRVLRKEKDHLIADHAIYAERYDIENDIEGKIVFESEYREQLQAMEDAIYIEELRKEELKNEVLNRQIYAGMDGIVTYVKNIPSGELSKEMSTVISVSDMSTVAFIVEEKDAEHFSLGETVLVSCNKKEYETVVVSAEELGMTGENEASNLYLKLTQPDPTLTDGDQGSIVVTLEQREDALYIEKDAIRMVDGAYQVSQLDENGLRVSKAVTIGLECGKLVEITDGLEVGERVILE